VDRTTGWSTTPPTVAGSVVPADGTAVEPHRAARAAFGALAIAAEVVVRVLEESGRSDDPGALRIRGPSMASTTADVVLGLGWRASHVTYAVARRAVRVVSPAISLALDPPLVPQRLRPRHVLQRIADTWVEERPGTVRSLTGVTGTIVPTAGEVLADLVDPAELLAQVLALVDLTPLTEAIIEELDLDSLLTTAMANLDMDQASRQLLEGVDLHQIVRESSGSMAAETVDSVRLQGIGADRAVERLVDRILRRTREDG
jgi:hypothetical protein